MKKLTTRSAFTFVAIIGFNLLLVSGLSAQSIKGNVAENSSRYNESLPDAATAHPVAPVYVGPTISTALPTEGRFRNGLQLGIPARTVPRRTVGSVSSTPFRTLPQRIQRPRPNVLQLPPSYLGLPSQRINGQTAARLAISRGVYGNVGFSGLGL